MITTITIITKITIITIITTITITILTVVIKIMMAQGKRGPKLRWQRRGERRRCARQGVLRGAAGALRV